MLLSTPAIPAFLGNTARYGWLALLAVIVAGATSGCAGLPKDVERPVSSALASPAGTPLGQLVEDRRASAGGRPPPGVLLLRGPHAAPTHPLGVGDCMA